MCCKDVVAQEEHPGPSKTFYNQSPHILLSHMLFGGGLPCILMAFVVAVSL
jgi:hypothetical protein